MYQRYYYFYSADEEPEITWSRNGKTIKKKKDKRVKIDWNISDDTHFLEIKESVVEDSGKYTVNVSNKSGSVEESVEVTVKLPAQEPQQEVQEEEVSADLSAKSEEKPEVSEEAEVEAVVKLPEFSMKPEAVSVVQGEKIIIKFCLVEGMEMECCNKHLCCFYLAWLRLNTFHGVVIQIGTYYYMHFKILTWIGFMIYLYLIMHFNVFSFL